LITGNQINRNVIGEEFNAFAFTQRLSESFGDLFAGGICCVDDSAVGVSTFLG